MTTLSPRLEFRQDVQGLRAVAIGLVVLAHTHVTGFAGGFVGVDVFFVLSGYLITGLLVRERIANGRIHYGRFLARRLRRLLPAMLLMIVTTLVLATMLLSSYEARLQTTSFPYAATWTSNIYFALGQFDYFAEVQTRDLFAHTWSLGVEEQFYIVWPWLVMLSLVGATATPTGRQRVLVYVFSTVLLISLLLSLQWTKFEPLLGFYMMPSRGWQFALGALVFLARDSRPEVNGLAPGVQGFAAGSGVLLMIGSAVWLDETTAYPGLYALAPSTGAALFLLAGARDAAVNRAFANRVFVWFGDRSYTLYLWHWPFLIFGEAWGVTDSAIGTIVLMALALGAADLTYRFVELPFWKGRLSHGSPPRVVAASIGVIALTIGAGAGLSVGVYGAAHIVDVEDSYNPRLDMPKIYAPQLGCDSWYESADLVACANGPKEGKSIMLLGDSIGAQWEPVIAELFPQPEWQLTVLTKSGCAIVDETYYYDRVNGNYDVCTDWRNRALAFIRDRQPEVVFVGSSWHYPLIDEQWIGGSQRIFESLAAAGSRVIVIPGTPSLSFNGPSCVLEPRRYSARLEDSRRECEEAISDRRALAVAGRLRDAAASVDNADVLDLVDIVCPAGRCAAQTLDGMIIFRDERHLTTRFVRAQAPRIRDRLDTLLAPGGQGVMSGFSSSLKDDDILDITAWFESHWPDDVYGAWVRIGLKSRQGKQ